MGERVVNSLNTNLIGAVTGGTFITVPDLKDLSKKADKTYVNKIQSDIINKLAEEVQQINEAIHVIEKRINTLSKLTSFKADKQAVKDILSESTMTRVQADIKNLFATQIQSIHNECVKEHKLIEKEMNAFNTLATNANKELASKLKPLNARFKNLETKIDTITSCINTLSQMQIEIDALKKNSAIPSKKQSRIK